MRCNSQGRAGPAFLVVSSVLALAACGGAANPSRTGEQAAPVRGPTTAPSARVSTTSPSPRSYATPKDIAVALGCTSTYVDLQPKLAAKATGRCTYMGGDVEFDTFPDAATATASAKQGRQYAASFGTTIIAGSTWVVGVRGVSADAVRARVGGS